MQEHLNTQDEVIINLIKNNMKKAKKMWIQKAVSKMKAKGTVGKFGKATEKKIKGGMKAGGIKKKEAVFAQNMKAIAKGKKKSKKSMSKDFNEKKYAKMHKKVFNLK